METILRSTLAAAAVLALTAAAFMPGSALAASRITVEPVGTVFVLETAGGPLNLVAQPGGDGDHKTVIDCGPGSGAPFLPCEEVQRLCALLGGEYETGSCTTPTWPPPASRD